MSFFISLIEATIVSGSVGESRETAVTFASQYVPLPIQPLRQPITSMILPHSRMRQRLMRLASQSTMISCIFSGREMLRRGIISGTPKQTVMDTGLHPALVLARDSDSIPVKPPLQSNSMVASGLPGSMKLPLSPVGIISGSPAVQMVYTGQTPVKSTSTLLPSQTKILPFRRTMSLSVFLTIHSGYSSTRPHRRIEHGIPRSNLFPAPTDVPLQNSFLIGESVSPAA